MYVALKIAGYVDCLDWTIATLCCTEPQQAVFRSCNAYRTLQLGSFFKRQDAGTPATPQATALAAGSSANRVQATSAVTSNPGKLGGISVLHRSSYCRDRPPGLISPTSPSAALHLPPGTL